MSSFWEEFKDLFKTQKQKDEEKSSELKAALESEKSLTPKLDELEKQYQSGLSDNSEELEKLYPSTLGLQKIEYEVEPDESIESRASDEINAKKTAKQNALDEDYQDDLSALDQKSASALSKKDDKEKELETLYSELKNKQKNDSVKRGVSRGSILPSLLEQLENNQSASTDEIRSAYEETVQSIDDQIDILNKNRETALEELDLKYAAELKDKIASLKTERDKTVASYVKYNNNVDEKETAYAAKREEDVSTYLKKQEKETRENEEKYGYSGEKLQNYSERYNLAYDFYMSLSSDVAADALDASPNMRYYLGNYYDKLMSELKNRESSQKKYF